MTVQAYSIYRLAYGEEGEVDSRNGNFRGNKNKNGTVNNHSAATITN